MEKIKIEEVIEIVLKKLDLPQWKLILLSKHAGNAFSLENRANAQGILIDSKKIIFRQTKKMDEVFYSDFSELLKKLHIRYLDNTKIKLNDF